MLGQPGIQRHSLGPQSIPLFIFCDNSDGIEGLGPNLDGDLRLRYQIVIPVRVSGCASGGGEHDQAVALGHISQWSRAALAALGPYSREQEQGCVFELPTDFAPICTELLNQAAIVVVHLSYGPSCYRCRPRRQLPYSVRCALFSSKLLRLFDNVVNFGNKLVESCQLCWWLSVRSLPFASRMAPQAKKVEMLSTEELQRNHQLISKIYTMRDFYMYPAPTSMCILRSTCQLDDERNHAAQAHRRLPDHHLQIGADDRITAPT